MKNIQTIISKYLSGNASDTEVEEILKWVKESEENSLYFSKLKQIWALNISSNEQTDTNTSTEFLSLKAKIRERENSPSIKMLSLRKYYGYWRNLAAVLFIPICLACLWLLVNHEAIKNSNQNFQTEVVQKELFTPKGVRGELVLPDSTIVCLNSGSRLVYPSKFAKNKREVKLEGEAYFVVKRDENSPFVIDVNHLKVKVLGTSFNVNAYHKDIVRTTLESGAVEIREESNRLAPVQLKPGYSAIYTADNFKMKVEKVNTRVYTSWRNGTIIFRDTPMRDVLNRLEKWYNIDIEVKDAALLKYSFTATLQNKTLPQILELLRISSPLGYTIENSKVILYKTTNN